MLASISFITANKHWDGWTEGPGGRLRLNRPFRNPWPLLEADPDGPGPEGEGEDGTGVVGWDGDESLTWEVGDWVTEDEVLEEDFCYSPWLRGS